MEISDGYATTNDDYHASSGISVSQLKTFISDPRLYQFRYLSGLSRREPPSPAMEFGTIVHEMVLEHTSNSYAIIPDEVLSKSGSRAGGEWKKFQADNATKILLKPSEYDRCRACAESVLTHPLASKLLNSPGPTERAWQYTDQASGLTLRCKPDKVAQLPTHTIIVDLKTTSRGTRPHAFVNAIATFGYHLQSYFYAKVLRACDVPVDDFIFVAVSDCEPYTVDCHRLDEDFLRLAETSVENALFDLAERTRIDNWLPAEHDKVSSLSPPAYLKYREEYVL